jgi:hypothetical protein
MRKQQSQAIHNAIGLLECRAGRLRGSECAGSPNVAAASFRDSVFNHHTSSRKPLVARSLGASTHFLTSSPELRPVIGSAPTQSLTTPLLRLRRCCLILPSTPFAVPPQVLSACG